MKLLHSFSNVMTRRAALVAVTVLLSTPALFAQQTFQVISDHSTAALYLGSNSNPTSYNAGIARVSGDAQINSDDSSASHFNFTIYAAGENSGDRPVISFESTTVKERSDGTLQVRGKLTVTQVERQITSGTGEDYSGPVYGPVQAIKTSHDATFVLAAAKIESTPDTESHNLALRAVQQERPESAMLMIGTTSITGEAFPELSSSVQNTAWPIPVNNEQCSAPSSVGEDYSGATCTGEVIEPAAAVVPSQNGEDYAGVQLVPPAGDMVTIQLKLVLANTDQNSTVGRTNGTNNTNSQSQAAAQ